MILTFNDFVQKHKLKNKAISNIKIQQILSCSGLSDIGIYLRDRSFSTDVGIVNLHPPKGTHWVCCKNENYFDSYGCVPHKKLSIFIIKRNGYCLYSEYQIQKNDSYCASYCLYKLYLTKIVGIDFRSAVLNLYYQMI